MVDPLQIHGNCLSGRGGYPAPRIGMQGRPYTERDFAALAQPLSVLKLSPAARFAMGEVADPLRNKHFRCLRDVCGINLETLALEKNIGPSISSQVRIAWEKQQLPVNGSFPGELEAPFERYLEKHGIGGSRVFTENIWDITFLGLDLRALTISSQCATALAGENIYSILDLLALREHVLRRKQILGDSSVRHLLKRLEAQKLHFDMPIPASVVSAVDRMILEKGFNHAHCLPVVYDMALFLETNPRAAYILAQTKHNFITSNGHLGFSPVQHSHPAYHEALKYTARALVDHGLLRVHRNVLASIHGKGVYVPNLTLIPWCHDDSLAPLLARALDAGPGDI